MKFATPHWLQIVLIVAAACLSGLGHSTDPALASYVSIANTFAGLLTGLATMLGITSHSAFAPTVTSESIVSSSGELLHTTTTNDTFPPPKGPAGFVRLQALAFILAAAFFASAVVAACTPAQSAAWSQVTAIVLHDVEAGDTLSQIELDVTTVLVGKNAAVVDQIINDVLTMLESIGAISVAAAPHEAQIHALVRVSLAAQGAK